MSLLKERVVYKPFEYPQAYDYWLKQQQAHWLHTEVPMAQDVTDWKSNMKDHEKNVVGQICTLYETGSVNHWDDENKGGEFYSALGVLNINDYILDDQGNDYRCAPWVLVFEQRLCKPNNFIIEYSDLHQDWSRFTQTDEKRFREMCNTKLTCIEVGMFVQTLAGLCLENDLGISYIRSFPEWRWKGKRGEYEKDTNKQGLSWDSLPEITETPLLICQIGHVANVKDFFVSNSKIFFYFFYIF